MSQPNNPDPIVTILQLAFRRGLAIQREQEEKNKAIDPVCLQEHILAVEQKSMREIEKVHPSLPARQTVLGK